MRRFGAVAPALLRNQRAPTGGATLTYEVVMDSWIVSDAAVLGGKPRIRGTRLSVEFILELVASGASRDDIVRAYPSLSAEAVAAAIRYAAHSLRNEVVWDAKILG